MSADRRGYRGRSWQWWAKRQLEHYTERQDARRVESNIARALLVASSPPDGGGAK